MEDIIQEILRQQQLERVGHRLVRYPIVMGMSGTGKTETVFEVIRKLPSRTPLPVFVTFHRLEAAAASPKKGNDSTITGYASLVSYFLDCHYGDSTNRNGLQLEKSTLEKLVRSWSGFRQIKDTENQPPIQALWMIHLDEFQFDPLGCGGILRAILNWNTASRE